MSEPNFFQLESPPETPRAQQTQPTQADMNKKRAAAAHIVVLLIACVVTIALAVLILRIVIRTSPHPRMAHICDTSDCQEHAKFLKQAMNVSASPCDDFYAFVCSNWKAESVYTGGNAEDTRDMWHYLNVPQLMNKGGHHFKATSKITAMLNSCLSRTASDNSYGLETMKKFTEERGIPWPWSVSKATHPLDVLLDLAINWITPIWFRLRLTKNKSKTRVYLTDAALTVGTYLFLLEVPQMNGEQATYNALAALYNRSQPTSPEEIAELFQVDKSVCTALIEANNAPNKTLAILKISDIEKLTPAISKGTWVRLLNKHTAGAYLVNDATEVFLDNRRLLVTIGEIFANFTSTQLLRHISWFFHVFYADVASMDSYAIFQNTSHEFFSKVSCHFGVDERYNLLVAAEHMKSNFSANERNAVNVMLKSVIENATSLLSQDASWIDDDGRKQARLKVPNIKVALI